MGGERERERRGSFAVVLSKLRTSSWVQLQLTDRWRGPVPRRDRKPHFRAGMNCGQAKTERDSRIVSVVGLRVDLNSIAAERPCLRGVVVCFVCSEAIPRKCCRSKQLQDARTVRRPSLIQIRFLVSVDSIGRPPQTTKIQPNCELRALGACLFLATKIEMCRKWCRQKELRSTQLWQCAGTKTQR